MYTLLQCRRITFVEQHKLSVKFAMNILHYHKIITMHTNITTIVLYVRDDIQLTSKGTMSRFIRKKKKIRKK